MKKKTSPKKPQKVKPWKYLTRSQREAEISNFMARSAYWV
jgi:hypothetical protein